MEINRLSNLKWVLQMEIVTLNKIKENEWKEFLDFNNNAVIYHTPEWEKLIEDTFNYKPYYLFAKNDSGEIVGMLPMFYVKNILAGNRLCCVPYAHQCGPIGSDSALINLIEEGINLYKDMKLESIEILDKINSFNYNNIFSAYLLRLSNVEKTQNLVHKSIRRYIKKSLNKVVVSKSNYIEDADAFYQVNCENKKDKGVASHPKNFFLKLTKLMSDNINIYLSNIDRKQTIGGIITLSYKDKVLYGYGATDPNFLDYHALYACLWRSIEDSCLKEYKLYDFGRSSYYDSNMANFKKRWGTEEKKLYYSYYPNINQFSMENMDSMTHRIITGVIRNMPMSIYKKYSENFWKLGIGGR